MASKNIAARVILFFDLMGDETVGEPWFIGTRMIAQDKC
jgi:hypothetical protein